LDHVVDFLFWEGVKFYYDLTPFNEYSFFQGARYKQFPVFIKHQKKRIVEVLHKIKIPISN